MYGYRVVFLVVALEMATNIGFTRIGWIARGTRRRIRRNIAVA